MDTPSKISFVPATEVRPGNLCLLKLENKLFLAFSCVFHGYGKTKPALLLINDKMSDGNRLYLLESSTLPNVHDLGTDFSIMASLHPDNVFTGANNDTDNILVWGEQDTETLNKRMDYMFVHNTIERPYYFDIKDGNRKLVQNRITEVNFHSWKIINNHDGEIVYSYPPV